MKLSKLILTVLMLHLGLIPATGLAQGRRDPYAEPQISSPFRGTVFHAATTSVTVKEGPAEAKPPAAGAEKDTKNKARFTIRSDTKILRDGKPIQAGDIKEGEEIEVVFTCKEGSTLRRVSEIHVGKLPPPGREPMPPPAGDKKEKKEKKGKEKP